MHVLGECFNAKGKQLGGKASINSVGNEDIKARAEVAVMTTMAKAQGQEVDDNDAEELIKAHVNDAHARQEQEAKALAEAKAAEEAKGGETK